MKRPVWRAGFELEVILGDLEDPRFETEVEFCGAMDVASPGFCRAVAKRLRELTKREWTAPLNSPLRPGYYVVSEYGLDPLHWPNDRVAGVEILTPPLPLDEADTVRAEIIGAIREMDGDFNFSPSKITEDCGWHINIDAGDTQILGPDAYILGTDEVLMLWRNSRLFGPYTGLQRHAAGIAVLRHLQQDRQGALLRSSGLSNLLNKTAGRGKCYAANFAKLARGYMELRHFSATSFFSGPSLVEQLDRIPAAMEMGPNQSGELLDIFLRKFRLLFEWLESIRHRLSWEVGPFSTIAQGRVLFDGEPVARLEANGDVELHLHGRKKYKDIASIRGILLPDVPEAVALLALDLAELRALGIRWSSSSNEGFQRAVSRLAARIRSDLTLSSAHQLSVVHAAEQERQQQYAAISSPTEV